MLTSQISHPAGPETFEWLSTSLWRAKRLARTPAKSSPRIVLVDDDPMFCRRAARVATRSGLSLATCTSVGEVLKASTEGAFDIAILDYWFGDLNALQIAHLLGEKTPIVLVSSLSRSEVHFHEWPIEIKEFVSKSAGIQKMLQTALGIADPHHAGCWSVAEDLPSVRKNGVGMKIVMLVAAAAAVTAAAWIGWWQVGPHPSGLDPGPMSPLRWDGIRGVLGSVAQFLASHDLPG